MDNSLSASSYNLYSNICKIFGMSEKFISCLNFSVFLSETVISIGMYLCAQDLRAGDWSLSKWHHSSLSVTALGRLCVPILSNKPIKRAGLIVSGSISFWRLLWGDLEKSYCCFTSVKRYSSERRQANKSKTVRDGNSHLFMERVDSTAKPPTPHALGPPAVHQIFTEVLSGNVCQVMPNKLRGQRTSISCRSNYTGSYNTIKS